MQLTVSKYSRMGPRRTKKRVFQPPKFLPRLVRYPSFQPDSFVSLRPPRSTTLVLRNSHISRVSLIRSDVNCCKYCSKATFRASTLEGAWLLNKLLSGSLGKLLIMFLLCVTRNYCAKYRIFECQLLCYAELSITYCRRNANNRTSVTLESR